MSNDVVQDARATAQSLLDSVIGARDIWLGSNELSRILRDGDLEMDWRARYHERRNALVETIARGLM